MSMTNAEKSERLVASQGQGSWVEMCLNVPEVISWGAGNVFSCDRNYMYAFICIRSVYLTTCKFSLKYR